MISEFLRPYPITKKALAEAMGTSTREVELAVNAARREGLPIVSDSDGYRLSQDPREIRDCADRLIRRLAHQAVTARALRRTARRLERAPTLWGTL